MSIFNRYKYGKNYKKLLFAGYMFNLIVFAIKLVYTAQLPAVIDFFGTTKANATLGLTIYYFVYAASQIALSFFITKINFKNYLLITSALSAITFSIITFTDSLLTIWVIFAVNGFLQAGCWGGLIYIFSKLLPNETLSFSNKILSTATTVGNAVTYAISAFFVAVLDWRYTFLFFGLLFLITIIYLFIQIVALEKIKKNGDELSFEYINQTNDKNTQKISYVVPQGVNFNVKLLMTYIIVCSFLANCLIYGLGNWIPNLLKDVHGFPTALSILLTMVMPLLSMSATIVMYNSFDKSSNIFIKSSVLAVITLVLIIVMIFGYDLSFIFAIFMCALLKFLPTSISAGYTSYTLVKIKNYINSGTSTLVVNSGAAIAAGAMPFITGLIMDNFGWAVYYGFMASLCLIAVIIMTIGSVVIRNKNNITAWFYAKK